MTALEQEAITVRRTLHAAPELSGKENNTASYITRLMQEAGARDIVTGLGGTGVAAVFGAGPRNLMIRCELDALPICETGDRPWRSAHPGVAHSCGHDGHMAILWMLARQLGRADLSCRVTLLFQPAEETGAGARAVLADPRFEMVRPDMALALHNLPGLPLGSMALQTGPVNCASRGLHIRLRGRSSHASEPDKAHSPAQALASLIEAICASGPVLPLDDPDFELVTITHACLGVPSFGITPGMAELRITLRTLLDARMETLEARLRALISHHAGGFDPDITVHEAFSHCENDAQATALLERASSHLSGAPPALPMRASEDFGLFGKICPSAMFFLGAGESCPPLHAPDYDFPDDLIAIGADIFLRAIEAFSGADPGREPALP